MSSETNFSDDLKRDFVLAAHGDLDKVKSMLAENPALLNIVYDWGERGGLEAPIGAAAHVGNRPIAEYLLEQGAPLNICVAAMLGRADEVQAFLDADESQANARGAHGIPVMFHAGFSGLVDIAQMLHQRGCNEGYSFALFSAVNSGNPALVAWLLAHGADEVNMRDFRGQTPLANALANGHDEIANLLRAHGAVENPE